MEYRLGTEVDVTVVDGEPALHGVVVGGPLQPGDTLVSGQPTSYPGDHPEYDPTEETRRWHDASNLSCGRYPVKLVGPDWDPDNPNYGYEGTTYYFPADHLKERAL